MSNATAENKVHAVKPPRKFEVEVDCIGEDGNISWPEVNLQNAIEQCEMSSSGKSILVVKTGGSIGMGLFESGGKTYQLVGDLLVYATEVTLEPVAPVVKEVRKVLFGAK